MSNNDPEQWQPEEGPTKPKSYYDVNPEMARFVDMLIVADKNGNMDKAWRGIAGEHGLTGRDILKTVWADRHNLNTDDEIESFQDVMSYFHEIRLAVNNAITEGKIIREQRKSKIDELMNRPIMIEVRI